MQKQMQINKPESYHFYNRHTLNSLIAICAISLIVFVIGMLASSDSNSLISIGGGYMYMALIVEAICIMVIDRRGALTLRGGVKNHRMNKGRKVSTAPIYIIFYILIPFIMIPIYLVQVTLEYRRDKLLCEQQFKYQIASLEAQLGILPPTDGECRECKKPLVVGAEFCQYCSAIVVIRPKVCLSCATTALPDAKWCPKCQAALS